MISETPRTLSGLANKLWSTIEPAARRAAPVVMIGAAILTPVQGILELAGWTRSTDFELTKLLGILALVAGAVSYVLTSEHSAQNMKAQVEGLSQQLELIGQNIKKQHENAVRVAEGQRAKEAVRVAVFKRFLIYMPIYIGIGLNHFDDEGLEIEFVDCGSDTSAIEAVESGACQFALTDPMAVLEAGAQSVRVIAPVIGKASVFAVGRKRLEDACQEATPERPITLLTYPKGSTAYNMGLRWAERQPRGLVKVLPLEKSAVTAATREALIEVAKGVDLAFLAYPDIDFICEQTELKQLQELHPILFDSDPFAVTSLMTTDAMLSERPGTVRRFLLAMRMAQKSLHALPPLSSIVAHTGLEDIANKLDLSQLRTDEFDSLGRALMRDETWNRVTDAVVKQAGATYGSQFQIRQGRVAVIMEFLRLRGYFAPDVTFDTRTRLGFSVARDLNISGAGAQADVDRILRPVLT